MLSYTLNMLNMAKNSLTEIEPMKPNSVDIWFLIVLLFTIVFVPFVPISASFNLSLEIILLLYPLVRLGIFRQFKLDSYSIFLFTFSLYIFFTIAINKHLNHWNEYFEILKVFKFILIYQFSFFVFQEVSFRKLLIKSLHVLFISYAVLNLIHFFDFFNFTRSFLIFYDPNQIDVQLYGLNSAGMPAAKRIIGTLGNPNDNAIFLLFFFVFYISRVAYDKINWKSIDLYGFIFSGVLVFLTQSRTGIVAMLFIFLIHLTLNRKYMLNVLLTIVPTIALIYLFTVLDSVSFRYMQNTSVMITQNNSFSMRIEIWKQLLREWWQKPFFGYGPNKAHMYANNVYPENEYIFYLWRYGIIGLCYYLGTVTYPVLLFLRKIKGHKFFLYFMLVILITALTNNPLTNMKFMLIIALVFGFQSVIFHDLKISETER